MAWAGRWSKRACYDNAKQFMVVELRSVYNPYCEMPAATFALNGQITSRALGPTALLIAARTAFPNTD